MAKITQHCCDRCGKEIKYIGWTGRFRLSRKLSVVMIHNGNNSGYEYSEDDKELCADCVKSYKEWLKGYTK